MFDEYSQSLTQDNQIGQILLAAGCLAPDNLDAALKLQKRQKTSLDNILIAEGMVSRQDIEQAIQARWQIDRADLKEHPPDKNLIDLIGFDACLKDSFVPWKTTGQATAIATSNPDLVFKIVLLSRSCSEKP